MLNQFLTKSKAFLAEVRRTGWAAFVVLLGLLFISKGGREILTQQVGVLAWKLVLLGSSVVAAHVVRKQLFPYLDVSGQLDRTNGTAGAIVFAAIAVIYSAIILAVCSGL
jgi:hypothetical protein